MAGSYTRLSKVTFVTGAGLTRAVIQLSMRGVCNSIQVRPLYGSVAYQDTACIEPLKIPDPVPQPKIYSNLTKRMAKKNLECTMRA